MDFRCSENGKRTSYRPDLPARESHTGVRPLRYEITAEMSRTERRIGAGSRGRRFIEPKLAVTLGDNCRCGAPPVMDPFAYVYRRPDLISPRFSFRQVMSQAYDVLYGGYQMLFARTSFFVVLACEICVYPEKFTLDHYDLTIS